MIHCKATRNKSLSFYSRKWRGSKCNKDSKTDTVPPTSSPFKASKLTGRLSCNGKILKVLGLGWATQCVWASPRLIRTVRASWIWLLACEIYRDVLRYHIFTASCRVKKIPEGIVYSNIALSQLWIISLQVRMREKSESDKRTALTNLPRDEAAAWGCTSCSCALHGLTSQC